MSTNAEAAHRQASRPFHWYSAPDSRRLPPSQEREAIRRWRQDKFELRRANET